MLRIHSVVTPAIAGGVATVTTPGFCGAIRGVLVKYSGAPSGTFTATAKHTAQPASIDEAIFTAVAAVNKVFQPVKPGQIPAGTDVANSWLPFVLNGQIKFDIAGGPNGQTVNFQVFIEE